MRRQNDDTLRAWAGSIAARTSPAQTRQVNLIFHGAPGTETPSSGHADDESNTHLLDFEEATGEDLERLGQLLREAGFANVVVKQHSLVHGTAVVEEARPEGEEGD